MIRKELYMKRNFHLIGLVLLVQASPVIADDAQQVTLRFLSFPKSTSPEPVELVIGEGEVLEIKAPSNALSTPYVVKHLGTWSFGKLEPAKSRKEKATFTSYGSAPSIASSDQLILLIRKGRENKDGLQVIPIDNRNSNFGGGKFFFMNASKVDIAGILGETKFTLKPGSQTIIEPAKISKRESDKAERLFTEFFFRKEDEARPFFSSTWPHNVKARSMVFFYHDTHNERLRMHTIRDYVP